MHYTCRAEGGKRVNWLIFSAATPLDLNRVHDFGHVSRKSGVLLVPIGTISRPSDRLGRLHHEQPLA
jgi:hypothetical protein